MSKKNLTSKTKTRLEISFNNIKWETTDTAIEEYAIEFKETVDRSMYYRKASLNRFNLVVNLYKM